MANATVDFIGIGAPRSGTTWLYRCLDTHPDIGMSRPKELNYFQDGPFPFSTHSLGERWYASRFPHPERRLHGEISPRYLDSAVAAGRIKERFPNCKIIVHLRSPADALYSFYHYIRNWSAFEPTFEEFIDAHPEHVRTFAYAEHLPKYLALFGKVNVHVIRYEDISGSPVHTLRDVYSFLGVEPIEPPEAHALFNTRRTNSRWYAAVHTWITKLLLPTSFLVRFYRPIQFVDALTSSLIGTMQRRPPAQKKMLPETRAKLVAQYRASNERLSELLGMDLRGWNN